MYIQLKALKSRKGHKKRRHTTLLVLIAVTVTLFVVGVSFGSANIDPVLMELAEPAAINLMNDTVNASYKKFVGGADITYDDLVKITRNESGQITSLNTDAELLNLMCIQIDDEVGEALKNKDVKIKVPLGSLTENEILSGKGPTFSMKLSQSNTVDTYTESRFTDAGVNQTEHEIIFVVKVTMTIILPNTTATYEFEQGFIVTQSIIVGNVPSYYTNNQ